MHDAIYGCNLELPVCDPSYKTIVSLIQINQSFTKNDKVLKLRAVLSTILVFLSQYYGWGEQETSVESLVMKFSHSVMRSSGYTQRNGSYGLLIKSKTDKWDHLTEHSNKKFF